MTEGFVVTWKGLDVAALKERSTEQDAEAKAVRTAEQTAAEQGLSTPWTVEVSIELPDGSQRLALVSMRD